MRRVLGYGIIVAVVAWLLCFGVTNCMDVATAIETTTLDEAVNRKPEPVMRYIDIDTGVACYYRKNKHGMSCVIPEKFPYPQ